MILGRIKSKLEHFEREATIAGSPFLLLYMRTEEDTKGEGGVQSLGEERERSGASVQNVYDLNDF